MAAAEVTRIHGHEPYLTKAQVAELLNVSVRWVEKWGSASRPEDERLPSVMVAGRRKYRWSEVQAWVDKGAAA